MSTWELSTNGGSSWTAFSAAGLQAARRTLVINGEDQFTMRAATATALTDEPAYAAGSTVIVRQGTTRWFYGRVVQTPQYGAAGGERLSYVLAGPWWYLAHCTYMQSWKVYDEDGAELTNVNKCRIVLCQGATGARIATGAQIGDAIDWAIARGAPITKGTIDTGITLPFDERDNMSCADVIQAMLRWLPDYVAWFDHSTAPYPTFHCRARVNLTAAAVALSGGGIQVLQVTPRSDMQVPGVVILYERTATIDDRTYNIVTQDTAGTADALDTVHAVFDLEGPNLQYIKAKVVTEDFPESLDDKAWWKARVPWLAEIADADLTIAAGARAEDSELPRILVEGTVPDWTNKTVEQEVVSCEVTALIRDEADAVVDKITRKVEVLQLNVTDASTGTYRRLESYDSGEAVPTGVAAALYASWSLLQYEGTVSLKADECAGAIAPGGVLNITGGRTAWATMRGLVSRIEEDVDRGETTIAFGPDRALEADSLVALFRALRSRRYSWRASSRTTGDRGAGEVTTGGPAPQRVASSHPGERRVFVVQDTISSLVQQIRLDPAQVEFATPGNAAAMTIRPREVLVAELDGSNIVFKLRQVLCSASYGTADSGQSIEPVVDVAYDTETGILSQQKRSGVKVLNPGTLGDPSTVATAQPCPE